MSEGSLRATEEIVRKMTPFSNLNTVLEQVVDAKTVLEAVQQRLQHRHPDLANLEVMPQEVRHEQDWWYISVRPDKEPTRDWEYFEALAKVETEMLTQENILVLMVPVPAGRGWGAASRPAKPANIGAGLHRRATHPTGQDGGG